MSRLTIVTYPDPLLLKVGKPVDAADLANGLSKTVEQMFETMYEAGGVGIAAASGRHFEAFFVMDTRDPEGGKDPRVFINPEMVHVEGEQIGDEGCLSFPGLYQEVQREMRDR